MRLGVMLRAARKASGKATSEANSVPTKAMTMVCSSLFQTSPCCHSALLRMLSQASAAFERSGSMRGPGDDQRSDLADGFAQERRVGVEDEIRPAEEAPPDDHLVALHLGAARPIRTRHRRSSLRRRCSIQSGSGVRGMTDWSLTMSKTTVSSPRVTVTMSGVTTIWPLPSVDGRLDDRLLADRLRGGVRRRLRRQRGFAGRRGRRHERAAARTCSPRCRRGAGAASTLPVDRRHLLDHPVRIGIGAELGKARIADRQIAVLELDVGADLVGDPVGEIGAGKAPVGLFEHGADREEPPAIERVEHAGEDAERRGIALPEASGRNASGWRAAMSSDGLRRPLRSVSAPELEGLAADQPLAQPGRKLVDGDDRAEQQDDDGDGLGLMAAADRQPQRLADAAARRPRR